MSIPHTTKPRRQFARVRPERAHHAVASQLRDAILSGEFLPGDRLLSEAELMDAFGSARSAVRRALQVLEEQGLVEVRVGASGGAFVRETDLEPLLIALTNYLTVRSVSVAEYLEAKAVLEPAITIEVAKNIDDATLSALKANVVASEAALDGDDEELLLDLSLEFHDLMASAIRNTVLQAMLKALVQLGKSMPLFREKPSSGWGTIVAEHSEMLDVLLRGTPDEAHALMQRHLSSVHAAFDTSEPK